LKLAGSSGTLAITNGIFQLAGGNLQARTISISGAGTFLLARGNYIGPNALSEAITDNGSIIDKTTATIRWHAQTARRFEIHFSTLWSDRSTLIKSPVYPRDTKRGYKLGAQRCP